MNFILWIIFGALAGWVASMIMDTNEKQGVFTDIIVGIIGAFIGGLIVQFFGAKGVTGFNLSSFLVAVIGSIVLLGIFKAVRK